MDNYVFVCMWSTKDEDEDFPRLQLESKRQQAAYPPIKANAFFILFPRNNVKNESGKRLKSGSQRDFVIQRRKTSRT